MRRCPYREILLLRLLEIGLRCTVSYQTANKPSLHEQDTKTLFTDKFDDNSGNYTQTVSVNDKTVSTLSTSDDKAQGWGSSVECAEDNCGTVGAHC